MLRRIVSAGCLLLGVLAFTAGGSATAAEPPLPRFHYYPYYYFPHNYWPTLSPKYPEDPNMPYQRPPAYMAYPPFVEPMWRYEYFSSQRFYRGNHFWLDQF